MTTLDFADIHSLDQIAGASLQQLDRLEFGVIGFDDEGIVRFYNATESRYSGLSVEKVVGMHLFTVVAPCMNNYMVAQKYEDALVHGRELDEAIDYVLTLRMRPTLVKLRMMARPGLPLRYLLLHRC
ncbi:photoactive yellow protein [Noviherbaspirillum humi]|uniref:Photoactive yellow protein n=1 Tax=Noviherbaspirillum humi TaxID=1688639 RepID=A0A239L508_9BURK|nr:PAS domain-containing protein [Noviherbaspirillum humi]SNT25531.1 photoactive yellow protein [Noviherbaspirillum humi]